MLGSGGAWVGSGGGGGGGSVELGSAAVGFVDGEFQYIGIGGVQAGDARATRNSSTLETHIGAVFGNSTFDMSVEPAFFGGVPFSGAKLTNSISGNQAVSGVADVSGFGGDPVTILNAVFASTFQYFANADSNGFNLSWRDQATNSGPSIEAIPTELRLKYASGGFGSTSGLAMGGGYIEWYNGNNSYFLPTNFPASTGESIVIDSISGNSVFLKFAPGGGGSPGGAIYDVQLNDGAGGFIGNGDFSFDYTQRILTAGDPTVAVNGTTLTVDVPNGSIVARVSKNFFSYEVANASPGLAVDYTSRFYSLGRTSPGYDNETYIRADDKLNDIKLNGARFNTQFSVTWSGGPALNDLTPTDANGYNGNNSGTSNLYGATIVAIQAQHVLISGPIGSLPQLGDIITNVTTGGTGEVYETDQVSYMIVKDITLGAFNISDTLTWTSGGGGTADVTGYLHPDLRDMYLLINNGTSYGPQFCSTGTTTVFSQGIGATFGALVGHTVGSSWNWSYAVIFGPMLHCDGAARNYQLGDSNLRLTIDSLHNTTNLSDSTSGFYHLGAASSFVAGNFKGVMLDHAQRYGFGNKIASYLDVNDVASETTFYTKSSIFGAVGFSGAGLNDMTVDPYPGSIFYADIIQTFLLEIDSTGTPDTFKLTVNGVLQSTGNSIVTGGQQLFGPNLPLGGIVVNFAADTGHTLTNSWTFTITPDQNAWASNNGGNRTTLIGDVNNHFNATQIAIRDIPGRIEMYGGFSRIVRDVSHGVTDTVLSKDFGISVTGSTGATTLNVDTASLAIGQEIEITDTDCNAATYNITIDAGTGKEIRVSSTGSQTLVLNANGASVTLRKMSSTVLKVV